MSEPKCRQVLYEEGKPSPRTCHVCGLGPCRRNDPPAPRVVWPNAPRFPTMLRKMWSGGEVQAWIDEAWPKSDSAKLAKALALLKESAATHRMWADVAPAVSLVSDIEAFLNEVAP